MEVMVAVLMLGMLMTAILTLQNITFDSVVNFSGRLTHIFELKNALTNAAFERAQQKQEKLSTAKDQSKEIKYSLVAINEKSALKKFDTIKIEKAVAEWQDGIAKRQETVLTFLYKAPEKKEAGKK